MSRPVGPVAAWARVTSLLLSLAGLGVAGYLTFTHFAGTQYLACSSTGTIDCALVTTSAQSYFLGIPVAVLGLGDFVALCALTSPWAWRSTRYAVHAARAGVVALSMAFVLWLVAAELLILDHICLWCTAVHVITFALFVVTMMTAPAQLGWVSAASSRDVPPR